MHLSVDYGNVGRSESIDYNVMRNLQRLRKYLELGDEAEVQIWINKQNSSVRSGGKVYEVGLFLYGKPLKTRVYISKIDNVLSRCMGRVFRSAQLKTRLKMFRGPDKSLGCEEIREKEEKKFYDLYVSPPNVEV